MTDPHALPSFTVQDFVTRSNNIVSQFGTDSFVVDINFKRFIPRVSFRVQRGLMGVLRCFAVIQIAVDVDGRFSV